MKNIVFLLFLATFVGCASLSTPTSSLIDSIPVVKVGELSDAPKDHIVFIPANTDFPIEFSVKGTLFNNEHTSTILASFTQDIYLYKYWASLDGRTWVNSHKLIDVEPSGGFDKSGGTVEVKLDIVK